MRKLTNITGNRYGRLTAIKYVSVASNGCYEWECICDCGGYSIVSGDHLRRGLTKSCGCLQGCGNSRSRFYLKWKAMKWRCKHSKYYYNITVDPEWNNFNTFKDDMYESYLKHIKEYGKKDTTLDRKNNDGPYSKENCRWATWSEQQRNRGHHVPRMEGTEHGAH